MYSLGSTEHNFFVSNLPFTSFCAKEISPKERTKLRDVWITLFSWKIFENQVSYNDGSREGDVVHLDEDSLSEPVLVIPERTLDYGRYVIQVEVSWVTERWNAQSSLWDMWISPKLCLDLKRLKLIGGWFPERSANFYLVFSEENNGILLFIFIIIFYALLVCRHYSILHSLFWGGRLKCADIPGIGLPFNFNI